MFDVFGALFSPVLRVLFHAIRTGVGGAGVDVVARGGFEAYPTGGMLAVTGEMSQRWETESFTPFAERDLQGGSSHSSRGGRGLSGGVGVPGRGRNCRFGGGDNGSRGGSSFSEGDR